MALPPSNGAENATVICAAAAVTVGLAGVLGVVVGIALADAADALLEPFAFVATTEQEYVFPLVSPPTTIGEVAALAVPAVPPFDDVQEAVYPVMTLPPSAGAVNVTVICASAAATVGGPGAFGVVLGVAAFDGGEVGPGPLTLLAPTVHVYDFPLVSPVTVMGEDVPFALPVAPPFDDAQTTL